MPPTNHLAQGRFHSRTLSQGLNQCSSLAALGPEGLGVGDGLPVERLVFGERLDVGLGGELGRRREDAVFAEGGVEVLIGDGGWGGNG